jgi:predicted regulator of Ras-like GTPase activity (Roadblock/LC7/MglB family)
MLESDLILYKKDHDRVMEVIDRLYDDTAARLVVLVDKNGQQIVVKGDTENFDTTSLASLTAGNVAATDGLAQLLGEREFTILFHEGEKDNIHISVVAQRIILVVIFDENSSLGLVRLRVRRSSGQLERIFQSILNPTPESRAAEADNGSKALEITDDDINQLFGG